MTDRPDTLRGVRRTSSQAPFLCSTWWRSQLMGSAVLVLALHSLAVGAAERKGAPQSVDEPAVDKPAARVEPPQPVPTTWNQGPLGAQAARLQRAYSRFGSTHRLRPRLLEQAGSHPLIIPEDALDPNTVDCVTITALGSPNLSFLLVFPETENNPARRTWPIPSAAGVAEVTRCGARKPLLADLEVKLRSRRGVVEFLLLRSEHPPPPVSELLIGRNPGPTIAPPQVGRRPWLAPLKARLAATKKAHRARGSIETQLTGLLTDEDGRGSIVLNLVEGCHALALLAEAEEEAPPDIDAHLYSLTGGEELVVDEEHRGEAHLKYCTGRADRVRLDVTGARPHTEVTAVHSRWEIPPGLPPAWGSVARAHLAHAIWGETIPTLNTPPVVASLGVRGETHLGFNIDPEGCYLAALAPIRGKITNLKVTVQLGSRLHDATGSDELSGVAVTFCGEGEVNARATVQVLGSGLAWILGVWRLNAGVTP